MTKELMSPVLNLLSKSAGSPLSDKMCVTDSVPERKMTALQNSAPYEDGQESRENNSIEEVLSQKVEIPRKCKEELTLKMQQPIDKYVEGSQWKEPFSKGEKDLPVTSQPYGFPEISKNSRTSIEKSPYSNDNGVQIQYKHEESLDEEHSEKLSNSHVAFETFHQILDNFQETNKTICVENDIGMVIKSTHEQFGVDCGQERILEPFASDNNATFHQENVGNECPGIVLQVNQTEMLKEFRTEPLEPNKANKALKNVVSKEQLIEKSLLCKEETAKVVGTLGDQGMPYCLSDGEEQGNNKIVSQNLNDQKISNDSFLSKGKISVADAAQTTAEDIPETVIGFQAKRVPKIESQNLVFTEHRLACAVKEHSSPLPTNCPTALLRSEDSLKVENLPNQRALEDNITVLRIQKRGEKNDITFEYRGRDVNEVRATMPAKYVVENTVSSFGSQNEVASRKNDIIFEYRGQDVNEIRATMPAKHVVENTASSFRSQDEVASESYPNDQDAYNSKSFKTKNCNESQREFVGDAKHSDLLGKFDIPVSGNLHESNTHGALTVYQESMHTKKCNDGGYRSQVTVVPVGVKSQLSDQATQLEDHTVPQHSIHLDEDSTEICLYQPIVKESYSGTDGKCVHSPSKTSGKFQWKSVYEATYIRTTPTNDEVSGTETLQAHQFCQVVPHFQSHRPLRVGLSKKQKVRRLHERSASQ